MLNYREATLRDLPQLLVLEQSVIEAERPYNSSIKKHSVYYYKLEKLISSDNACVFVAEDKETIVGTGYVQITESKKSLDHSFHGYLGFMFVAPKYRGKGINQNIVSELIAWSEGRNIYDFYLDVYSQNQAALSAYEKAGFKPSMVEMKLNTKNCT